MSQDLTLRADPALTRLAEAILIPPFPGRSAPRWILEALGRGLAGVTLFGQNISTPEQVSALTASLRAAGQPEPVIAIDEEGGDVTRVAYADGSPYPGNAALGAVDDIAATRAVYQAIGADLAALGVNFNLAPCADVLDAADSPAVGTRSFGMDTALVSRHTAAAVTGLQDAATAGPGPIATRPSPPSTAAWPSSGAATCRRSRPRSRPAPSPSCPATCGSPS
jgi:beta-N-acetylhexosaminidase